MDCIDDNVAVDFVHRRLSEAERNAVELHIDRCASCRRLISELARISSGGAGKDDASGGSGAAFADLAALTAGAAVDRYVVLGLVGVGAMGVVYAAYDPRLDRKVALKLLRGEGAAEIGRERLLREARALARLSHPNVVGVFDVGTCEHGVFVSMEFVAGRTLETAMAEGLGGWRSTVQVFVRAGRGLAAAHRAGLVHRDFKPRNVLMGHDGSVKVADFGLVRSVESPADRPPGEIGDIDGPKTDVAVTASGTAVGTPAYMAPELFAGRVADARSDQFSFCVALFEALYGQRPFGGERWLELADSVASGEIRPPPDDRDAPAAVQRAILRGLRVDPDARHPSLDTLVAALHAATSRRPRWHIWTIALGGLAIAGTVLAAARHAPAPPAPPCPAERAAIDAVWKRDVASRIGAAFAATHAAGAEAEAEVARRRLDRVAAEWQKARHRACVDTRVDRAEPEPVLAARRACLDQQLFGLRETVRFLSVADKAMVKRAGQVVADLPAPSDCLGEADAVRSGLLARDSEAADLDREIVSARIARVAGRGGDKLASLTRVVERAQRRELRAVEADGRFEIGAHHLERSEFDRAEQETREALLLADAIGYDALRVLALLRLVHISGQRRQDWPAAMRWMQMAEAAAERAPEGPSRSVKMLEARAAIERGAGNYARALEVQLEAVRLREQQVTREPADTAIPWYKAAIYARDARDLEAAARHAERAGRLLTEAYGSSHPEVATVWMMLALVEQERSVGPEDRKSALAAARRAFEATPEDHPQRGQAHEVLGWALSAAGQFDEALAHLAAARRLRAERYGTRHPIVAGSVGRSGQIRLAQGRNREGLALLEEALAIESDTLGDRHGRLVTTLGALSLALENQGHVRRALTLARRASTIAGKALPPDNPDRTSASARLGAALAAAGETTAARRLLEPLVAQKPSDPIVRADAEAGLARALWPGDRVRARALMAEAVRRYREAGPLWAPAAARAAAWLTTRARARD